MIGDPGNAPSGTALTDPTQLVDAGVMVGTAYGVVASAPTWSIATSGATKPGAYKYQCTIHDWMQGALSVAVAGVAQTPAQIPARMPSTGAGGAPTTWGGLLLLGLLLIGLGTKILVTRRI